MTKRKEKSLRQLCVEAMHDEIRKVRIKAENGGHERSEAMNEELKYLRLYEKKGGSGYEFTVQLSGGGGSIALRRGERAELAIDQLRELAAILELELKDRNAPRESGQKRSEAMTVERIGIIDAMTAEKIDIIGEVRP